METSSVTSIQSMPAATSSTPSIIVDVPANTEVWGDVLRRRTKELDQQVRERVIRNLEALMRNSVSTEHINTGRIKVMTSQLNIPKTATLTDGCEWKAVVDDWADAHKLQATFHPIPSNCPCIRPTSKRLVCICTPKITFSW